MLETITNLAIVATFWVYAIILYVMWKSFRAQNLLNLIIYLSQESLRNDRDKLIRLRKHAEFLDKINDKYGEYTVFPGVMWDSEEMARDRIGFRKIVEVKQHKTYS